MAKIVIEWDSNLESIEENLMRESIRENYSLFQKLIEVAEKNKKGLWSICFSPEPISSERHFTYEIRKESTDSGYYCINILEGNLNQKPIFSVRTKSEY